ncbi:aldo/keto reductase [Mesobacillus foraminis]|uniref:aldo/keto reductase n=1 Tax=Mesobacillus foraminis TaxID=279826 RepID=UPI000EF46B69|nr:aldo/keto reductase [Mesobacillus foraminis]
MNYRTLGRTGLKVSEIGYGAWGIGQTSWVGASDEESLKALNKAIDLGLNFIDTALAYGNGHSERLVGEVVRKRSGKIHVATKVPPKNMKWPASREVSVNDAYPAQYVIEKTEESLRNLGLETIDVQQFHVWTDEWTGQGDWLEAVEQLKKDGKIQHFGISVNDNEPENVIKLIETGVVDTVQVIYNIFEQLPEDRLFPACEKYNTGIIVRVPLDEGGLTGKITPESTFPEGDFRNHYFRDNRKQEVYQRVQNIASDLEIAIEQMPETALRFILSNPLVSTVIPGMRSVRHAEANCTVGSGEGLTQAQLDTLAKHRWIRNFYK